MADAIGLPTVQQPGGAAEQYDGKSTLVGEQTHFQQKARDLEHWYFKEKFPELDPDDPNITPENMIKAKTTGFCHGIANASAYGEQQPNNLIGLWLVAIMHSGDSFYQPGNDKVEQLKQLMEDLVAEGRRFVIETQGKDGYWSRIAWRVNKSRTKLLATNFGKPSIVIPVDSEEIKNVYVPVTQGEESNYPPGTVNRAIAVPEILDRWTFSLKRELVYSF